MGGLNGYVSGTLISSTKLPPSYGVSGGPAISPFNSVRLSLTNSTLIAHFAIYYKHQINKVLGNQVATNIYYSFVIHVII